MSAARLAKQSAAATVTRRVDADRVRGLQLLIDPDAAPLLDGDPLPTLWHWVALPDWTDPALTGHDGHPRRPGPLADITAVRRMFAGGEVEFAAAPIGVGDVVTIVTEVADVTTKSGRSGEFVLATFRSRVTDAAGRLLLTERQDVVYTDPRPAPPGADASGSLPIVGRPLISLGEGEFELRTDPTILMRFSSMTANAHRIHYDLAYAREVEQLPGLLVHGPLMNLALVHIVCASHPRRRVRRITHRNLNPLFCGQSARLHAAVSEGGVVTAEITGPGDGAAAVKGRVRVEFHEVPGMPHQSASPPPQHPG